MKHPGLLIAETVLPLYARNVTVFAKALGMNRVNASKLVNGRAGISVRVARTLERLGHGEAREWMIRQAEYDLEEPQMLKDPPIAELFQNFRRIRQEIADAPDDPLAPNADRAIREGAMLGIGILLGGSFPGAAASVSMLLERQFPDVEDWPWEPVE